MIETVEQVVHAGSSGVIALLACRLSCGLWRQANWGGTAHLLCSFKELQRYTGRGANGGGREGQRGRIVPSSRKQSTPASLRFHVNLELTGENAEVLLPAG